MIQKLLIRADYDVEKPVPGLVTHLGCVEPKGLPDLGPEESAEVR